jgi:hypothetical protein
MSGSRSAPFRRSAKRVVDKVGVKDELDFIEFFEEAVRMHETHAAHARQAGDEATARRAEERAARARERLRLLLESYFQARLDNQGSPRPGISL